MSKHILMIPLQAFGHLIPLLALANRLGRFFRVTVAVSQYLVDDIKGRSLLSEENENIVVHSIEDGFVGDTSIEKTGTENFKRLAQEFSVTCQRFLASIYSPELQRLSLPEFGKINAVIVDNLLAGEVALCYQQNIPVYHFNTSSAGKASINVCDTVSLHGSFCPALILLWTFNITEPVNTVFRLQKHSC